MYCFIQATRYFINSSFLVWETSIFLFISCSTISFIFYQESVTFYNSSRYFFIFYFISLLSSLFYSNIFFISFFVFSNSSYFRLFISITIFWEADYWLFDIVWRFFFSKLLIFVRNYFKCHTNCDVDMLWLLLLSIFKRLNICN